MHLKYQSRCIIFIYLLKHGCELYWSIVSWVVIFCRSSHLLFDNQKYTTSNLLDDGAQFINCCQNYVAHLWKISGRVEINDRWLQTSPRKWLSRAPLHPVGPGQKGYQSHHDVSMAEHVIVIVMSYSPASLTEEFPTEKKGQLKFILWLLTFDLSLTITPTRAVIRI